MPAADRSRPRRRRATSDPLPALRTTSAAALAPSVGSTVAGDRSDRTPDASPHERTDARSLPPLPAQPAQPRRPHTRTPLLSLEFGTSQTSPFDEYLHPSVAPVSSIGSQRRSPPSAPGRMPARRATLHHYVHIGDARRSRAGMRSASSFSKRGQRSADRRRTALQGGEIPSGRPGGLPLQGILDGGPSRTAFELTACTSGSRSAADGCTWSESRPPPGTAATGAIRDRRTRRPTAGRRDRRASRRAVRGAPHHGDGPSTPRWHSRRVAVEEVERGHPSERGGPLPDRRLSSRHRCALRHQPIDRCQTTGSRRCGVPPAAWLELTPPILISTLNEDHDLKRPGSGGGLGVRGNGRLRLLAKWNCVSNGCGAGGVRVGPAPGRIEVRIKGVPVAELRTVMAKLLSR